MGYEPGDLVSGFDLPNANGGENVSLDQVLTDIGAVVVFECNHVCVRASQACDVI